MDLFKTDADLEAESARPKSPVSRRRKVVPLAVAACCAAAAFPLGDAAQGTNLLFGPLAAAGITGLISWRSVPGGSAALAFVAALLTSAFMLAAVFVALLLFGV